MRKLNSNNALAGLSEDQFTQIYNWLHAGMSYDDAITKLAQAPPEGFALQASVSCLKRFYQRRRHEDRVQILSEEIPLTLRPFASGQFHQAAAEEFAHLTYEAAHSPQNPRTYAQLASWFSKYEYNQIQREYLEVAKAQTETARQRLELARTEFRFNAARQALFHADKLTALLDRQDIDNEEKIWKAGDVIFPDQPLPPGYQSHPTPQITVCDPLKDK